jgi:STE24 endopeptidase
MSAVLSFVLVLPVLAGSVIVVSLVGSLLWPDRLWLLPVLWVLSGGLLFLAPVERALSALALSLRRPTPAETAKLVPLWQSVCDRAGVNGDRYVLMVEDSHQMNAMAAGGRTVAVTAAALRLPSAQLEAVLAHELGHHLSGHTVVSTLAWWYAVPVRAAAWVVRMAARFVLFLARVFTVFGKSLAALVAVLIALTLLAALAFVSFWLFLAPFSAPLLAWASRMGEFRADRVAARFGYAPGLTQVLNIWLRGDPGQPKIKARLLASHPPHIARIRRLQDGAARYR